MPAAPNKEYTIEMPIYDVRDYVDETQTPGICTFGGFIGELLITLASIEQCILKSNENHGFKFTAESIQNFLTEILAEIGGYPVDLMTLKLPKDPLTEEQHNQSEGEKAKAAAKKFLFSENLSQFGLKFLLDTSKTEKELGIGKELVEELFVALGNIHYCEQQELVPVPEEDPEKEEQDPALEKAIEDAQN